MKGRRMAVLLCVLLMLPFVAARGVLAVHVVCHMGENCVGPCSCTGTYWSMGPEPCTFYCGDENGVAWCGTGLYNLCNPIPQ